ncbi:MAG: NAD(P)/FAD-dependent oxidoreductase [Chloroflexota bacterium]|jgi:protoporphyrinogen oxidase
MNIAIVGAGATGLAAAHDFLNAGHQVTIFEASDRPGGLAAGFKEPHWRWTLEKFYHHWFSTDTDLLKLSEEIGVRDRVIFCSPKTVSYYDGNFYPIFSPKDALTFPGVSLPAKVPWGLSAIFLKATSNWKNLEKITAHKWASRWMGKAAYEALIQPMLEGKFGEYAKDVNMAWLWARVKSRSFDLGTFVGGFQAFFNALAESVIDRGARIWYNTPVEHIEQDLAHTWHVKTPNSPFADQFDRVLVTTSPQIMSRLVPQLPSDYLRSLNNMKSLGAIVTVFALNQPLSPNPDYYWYNMPKNAGFPFLCLCEHTNFVDPQNFGGDRIVYCGDYLPTTHPYFAMSDHEIASMYLAALTRINPAFEPSWLRKFWVFREAYAQPVPMLNHSQQMPSTRTPLTGLWFASMSHVYPWDRGTNYAIQLGRCVSQSMMTP